MYISYMYIFQSIFLCSGKFRTCIYTYQKLHHYQYHGLTMYAFFAFVIACLTVVVHGKKEIEREEKTRANIIQIILLNTIIFKKII